MSADRLALPVLELGPGLRLVRTNNAWTALTGLDAADSSDYGWCRAAPDDVRARLQESSTGSLECPVSSPDGIRWTRWLWSGDEQSRLVAVVDLSDHRRREQQLADRASRDSLTGVVNQETFVAAVDRALRSGDGPAGVVFIDLDGFKSINDTGGHALGDELLRLVAERLHRHLRARDVLGRVGGDEFAVLCTGAAVEVMAVANRVAEAFKDPFAIGDQTLPVSATFGVAVADGAHESARALLARADTAMYGVKRRRTRLPAPRPTLEPPAVVPVPVSTADRIIQRLARAGLTISAARGHCSVEHELDGAVAEIDAAVQELRAATLAASVASTPVRSGAGS